jgi:hypothetical protein
MQDHTRNTLRTRCAIAALLATLALSAPTALAAPAATEPRLGERDLARLAAPEPGAPAAEYRVRAVTLRLFGTQGEGPSASATLADTASWVTRTYRKGESIGRSLILSEVRKDAAELRDTLSGAVYLVPAGAEQRVRLVEHSFDYAVIDHGQHQSSVRAAALSRILSRYGTGATATEIRLHATRVMRLSAVQRSSALDRLGFQEGDLIARVNGQLVAETPGWSPTALCALLSQPSSQVVLVQLFRGGALYELAFSIE